MKLYIPATVQTVATKQNIADTASYVMTVAGIVNASASGGLIRTTKRWQQSGDAGVGWTDIVGSADPIQATVACIPTYTRFTNTTGGAIDVHFVGIRW